MNFFGFLLLVGLFLLGFKFLEFLVKGTFFVIGLPFIILFSVLAPLFLVFILPAAIFSGLAAVFLVPLGILDNFLPLILIGVGIYLLARRPANR